MKKLLAMLLSTAIISTAAAQTPEAKEPEGYKFTDKILVPTTPVKDQHRSGTCWCYSTVSFLENELLKAGYEEIHLSEMYIVRYAYLEKAIKYIRMHGHLNFAEGGASHDVMDAIAKYGVVPHDVYQGFNYGTEKADFHELAPVMKGYLDGVLEGAARGRALTTAWINGFNAILDAYFGEVPETFEWKGKEYTPKSFAASLPIHMEDYIDLSSFTHHPFYETFILEVPDNWCWGEVYNLPLNEFTEVVDYALQNGYSIAWGTDVSEKGFSRTKSIGIVPDIDLDGMSGTESARWGNLTKEELAAMAYKFEGPVKELEITQEMRQKGFDNFETCDDHGMVIMGTAVDQVGHEYYKVQNSWNVNNPYKGFWYFSKPFFQYKTTSITINKNALPKHIQKKLGLK